MDGSPGARLPHFGKRLRKNSLKEYLTPYAFCAIIITVIGGTMVNPKYRKEVNKNGNF